MLFFILILFSSSFASSSNYKECNTINSSYICSSLHLTYCKWPVSASGINFIDFSNNQIKEVELEMILETQKLSLRSNQLQSISISIFRHLPQLMTLDISYNQIHTLSTDPQLVHISIQSLDLNHNQLTDIGNWTQLLRLQSLNLSFNQVSVISFNLLPAFLRLLDISSNPISTITSSDKDIDLTLNIWNIRDFEKSSFIYNISQIWFNNKKFNISCSLSSWGRSCFKKFFLNQVINILSPSNCSVKNADAFFYFLIVLGALIFLVLIVRIVEQIEVRVRKRRIQSVRRTSRNLHQTSAFRKVKTKSKTLPERVKIWVRAKSEMDLVFLQLNKKKNIEDDFVITRSLSSPI